MSDSASPSPELSPAPSPEATPQPVAYATPATSADALRHGGSPLLRAAGFIGLIACLTGFAVLFAGCAGVRLFVLAPAIVYAGAAGIVLSLIAAVVQRRRITEETHLLLSLFTNLISILGGLLEMAVLKGWKLFP